jgi:hypothetical protein
MPVPPKPADQRRNRNRKIAGEWVVLDEVYSGPIPRMPKLADEWTDDSKRWWRAIWRTPMATQWLDDVGSLAILAFVRQRLLGGDMRLLSEVRQWSDDFGLTPKGRQMRRWVISEKDAERARISSNEGIVADLREQRARRMGRMTNGGME